MTDKQYEKEIVGLVQEILTKTADGLDLVARTTDAFVGLAEGEVAKAEFRGRSTGIRDAVIVLRTVSDALGQDDFLNSEV